MFLPVRHRAAWLAVGIAAAFAGPNDAAAQPTFLVEARASAAGVQDGDIHSGATPQMETAGPVSNQGVTAAASSLAGYCRLSGMTSAISSAAAGMGGFSGSGRTRASFTFDDLVFSGPSSPVTVNGMNVSIVGSLTAAISPSQNFIEIARMNSNIQVGGFSLFSFTRLDYVGSTGSAVVNDGGLLAGAGTLSTFPGGATLSFGGVLTTGSFSVPVGVPRTLSLTLNLQGNAGLAATGGVGEASTAFSLPDGLSIALAGLIFNLPAGYTVNSAQARIVDNRCHEPLRLMVENDQLLWSSSPAASAVYDIVRGDLLTLQSSGGDFTASTAECLANDWAAVNLPYSDVPMTPGEGFWYLVREVTPAGNLSYNSGGAGQVGLRDAEIDAAPTACP